jgi:primosomal protein N' (replication factor Y)
VGEVTGPRAAGAEAAVPAAPVLIGTEAVLHRVRRAATVVFLDIDLHLLAARLSAAEETMALFVRAARLVGARGAGPPWARMQAQTRVPEHPLLRAVALGEPTEVLAEEVAIRRASALPPFSALAIASGALGPAYAEALSQQAAADADVANNPAAGPVSVSPIGDDRFLLRAVTHEPLCDLLARTPRPPGRGLRVEVDPVSL